MAKFLYKAKKSPTDLLEGIITADNKTSAIQRLSNMGYYLISVDEYITSHAAAKKGPAGFLSMVSLKDVSYFTRQFSDLLESGLTVVKALDIMHNQTENKRLKDIVLDLRDYCTDGNPLSAALRRHPRVFPNLYVSLVGSGEAGGALASVLLRLADFYDTQLDIRTKIQSALAYPVLMSVVGLATIALLVTFVIPNIAGIFSDLGQNLPVPTLFLLAVSGAVKKYWWLMVLVFFIAGLALARMYKTKEGKAAVDRVKMRSPVFGALIKKIEIARFARTLGTLLANGVPMLESLRVTADTVNNEVIREALAKAASAVRSGSSLADGFTRSPVIPPLVVNMIAVGEESGRVEPALFKVAESYDRESDAAIKIMMSLLEPALILTLGLVVGFIVISMLLPIFEMNFLAR